MIDRKHDHGVLALYWLCVLAVRDTPPVAFTFVS